MKKRTKILRFILVIAIIILAFGILIQKERSKNKSSFLPEAKNDHIFVTIP